ncbi:NAD(P)-binding protein [Aspergillus steynii IBT 23096]|uniref:NAD(P)-binding protein n=1 Tax=Aspergillus steynii IBT 23096 TaxID=1392250 RepID=A0A2I2FZR4_9EURO|nr:NAD(P)-binding protein [Aspergillus steynii IBT 23096]PLB46111.1 NAD(P)-binding protein [Aspergillus steynii IBT 23096]
MSTPNEQRQVIALAGNGNLSRYLIEELCKDDRYAVAVLTRQEPPTNPTPNLTYHQTDYTLPSLISILTSTRATTLISTLNPPEPLYLPLHTTLLSACLDSPLCKRFIPSDWAGNVEDFPNIPRMYGRTRAPFRETLRQTPGIKSTSFNFGWFMDYFLTEEKSYMAFLEGEFPVDPRPSVWRWVVRGTGEEPQAWTCARDVARAVVVLLGCEEWEPVTYITGQRGTYKEMVKILERFYDRPFRTTHRSLDDINRTIANPSTKAELTIAEVEEWEVSGATACPEEKTERQYEKFFKGMKFMSVEEMLRKAETEGRV